MRLSERVDNLEGVVVKHLEESGTIRTDLAWLKKAFWTLTAAAIAAVLTQLIHPTGDQYDLHHDLPQMQQKP